MLSENFPHKILFELLEKIDDAIHSKLKSNSLLNSSAKLIVQDFYSISRRLLSTSFDSYICKINDIIEPQPLQIDRWTSQMIPCNYNGMNDSEKKVKLNEKYPNIRRPSNSSSNYSSVEQFHSTEEVCITNVKLNNTGKFRDAVKAVIHNRNFQIKVIAKNEIKKCRIMRLKKIHEQKKK